MSGTVGLILTAVFLIAVVVWFVLGRLRRGAAWKQVASELGAEYVGGGLFGDGKVIAHNERWPITLDSYSTSTGEHSTTYTRMRAPFQNREAFEFSLHQEGIIGHIEKAFGAQDIQVGDPEFDRAFVIWGNNQAKVRTLLADAKVRQLIQAQPHIRLSAKGSDLRVDIKGVITDAARLKSLFELFKELLPRLES